MLFLELMALSSAAGESRQEWRHGQTTLVRLWGAPAPPPLPPASRCSKLHTRSARPSVSACNLEAASGPGTLERSKPSAEGPPERLRDAPSSCRVKVTACCWQADLGKDRC